MASSKKLQALWNHPAGPKTSESPSLSQSSYYAIILSKLSRFHLLFVCRFARFRSVRFGLNCLSRPSYRFVSLMDHFHRKIIDFGLIALFDDES